MQFKYGNFLFLDNECLVTFFGKTNRYNARGLAQTSVYTMVVEGEIVAAGQNAIDARARLITTALSLDGGSAVLYRSDGAATVYALDNTNARSIRVTNNSLLQQDGKAHYATGLPFSFTIEAEYGYSYADDLVSYEERITRIGTGEHRRVWPEVDQGTAEEQIVSTASNVTVVQTGSAVGAHRYPTFSDPIFPNGLGSPEDYQTTTGTPRHDANGSFDWPISWTYRMTLPAGGTVPNPLTR